MKIQSFITLGSLWGVIVLLPLFATAQTPGSPPSNEDCIISIESSENVFRIVSRKHDVAVYRDTLKRPALIVRDGKNVHVKYDPDLPTKITHVEEADTGRKIELPARPTAKAEERSSHEDLLRRMNKPRRAFMCNHTDPATKTETTEDIWDDMWDDDFRSIRVDDPDWGAWIRPGRLDPIGPTPCGTVSMPLQATRLHAINDCGA